MGNPAAAGQQALLSFQMLNEVSLATYTFTL